MLLPSRLPDKQGNIILPESYTKKSNSGICFAPAKNEGFKLGVEGKNDYFGMECFFPSHCEFQIIDTDTDQLIYIVEANKIILTRTPPKDILRASMERDGDNFNVSTMERSQK